MEFKFFIDENTDIDDVIFVVRNHVGCTRDDIGCVNLSLMHTEFLLLFNFTYFILLVFVSAL